MKRILFVLAVFINTVTYAQDSSKKIIFTYVEQMPQFNGDVHQYIKEHLQYPPTALQQQTEGRVTLKFIIDTSGKILQPEIVRSTDTVFNKEALRIIRQMPPWKPGKNNGHSVNTTYTLPISFRLNQ